MDGGSGRRFVNVALNGTTVVSSLDVYAAAGNSDLKAVERDVYGVADNTGTITLSFTADLTATYPVPFINAIEVLSNGVTQNSYDPNGNLQTATDWTGIATYTWDSENRLLSVASGLNGIETYTYASDSMRRKKVTSAQTTNFVWDRQNVLQERSVSNVRLAQYNDYPGQWGGLTSQRQGSASSYYGFDSQSSTRILVSIAGIITDNYAYKAFGEELAQGQGPVAQYTNNPYRYVGQYGYYRDAISRLYVRARHLSGGKGRWINRDPLGFYGEDVNRYWYVENNPVSIFDATGKAPNSGRAFSCSMGIPIDVRGNTTTNPSKCALAVCKAAHELESVIDDISAEMCGGAAAVSNNPIKIGGQILHCNDTQICLYYHGFDCDDDPPVGTICYKDDTGGIWKHACCIRCEQCVCTAFGEPSRVRLELWLRLALRACNNGGKSVPKFPGVVNLYHLNKAGPLS